MVTVVDINLVPVEWKGRNWVGNIYKYRWAVYVIRNDDNKYGTQSYWKGEWIPVKIIFTGTKPEVKKWLKERNIVWEWKK